jgi:hypothetical protein
MTEGYRPGFKAKLEAYNEKNRSDIIHRAAVTEKLAKWLTNGYVEEVTASHTVATTLYQW